MAERSESDLIDNVELVKRLSALRYMVNELLTSRILELDEESTRIGEERMLAFVAELTTQFHASVLAAFNLSDHADNAQQAMRCEQPLLRDPDVWWILTDKKFTSRSIANAYLRQLEGGNLGRRYQSFLLSAGSHLLTTMENDTDLLLPKLPMSSLLETMKDMIVEGVNRFQLQPSAPSVPDERSRTPPSMVPVLQVKDPAFIFFNAVAEFSDRLLADYARETRDKSGHESLAYLGLAANLLITAQLGPVDEAEITSRTLVLQAAGSALDDSAHFSEFCIHNQIPHEQVVRAGAFMVSMNIFRHAEMLAEDQFLSGSNYSPDSLATSLVNLREMYRYAARERLLSIVEEDTPGFFSGRNHGHVTIFSPSLTEPQAMISIRENDLFDRTLPSTELWSEVRDQARLCLIENSLYETLDYARTFGLEKARETSRLG